jgi:hypothetical protein
MMRIAWPAAPIAAVLVAMTPVLPNASAAAQTARTLDIGVPPGDSTARACLADSIVDAALAAFNSPAAARVFGGGQIPAGIVIRGSYNVFEGVLKLDGTVQGDVVVLNGSARVTRTGVVSGTITVLGGRLVLDPGATVGKHFACEAQPALVKSPNGTVGRLAPTRTIGSMASGVALTFGDYRITPHIGIGQYNRVEALPIQLGADASRRLNGNDSVRADVFGIVRTGRDAAGSRSPLGWHASAAYSHRGTFPFTVRVEGGSTIEATVDRPFSAIESGVSAFVLRRDYNDWYLRRGASITADARLTHELTLSGTFDLSHQTTVLAIEAFSLFRNTESWRPNPLIDDGTYRTITGRVVWDARDPLTHPVLSWFVRGELNRVSSNSLTPVSSVPTTIRDALPATGYGETDGELDLRVSLRIDPEQRLNFRVFGDGYAGGDPLTIQRRRAIGSADPLLGYDFRGINCDRQRKPYLSTPALCDRSAVIQAEYHRTLAVNLGTRINGYTIGLRKPDLVVFADAASAWLAGDSAGRVPANRIQTLGEWRSDVGVGVVSGPFGLFIAKAITEAIPVRLTLRFTQRF